MNAKVDVSDHPIWCQTFTGRAFPLLAPTASDIDWRDVAAALSKQCRYNGHVQAFYSVAQHSVIAADFATTRKLWDAVDAQVFPAAIERIGADLLFRTVLLHDASESYIGDLTTPMKEAMRAITAASPRTIDKPSTPGKTELAALAWNFDGLATFDAVEQRVAAAVSAKAGLPWPLDHVVEAAVKRADVKMLALELRDLMAPPPRSWRLTVAPPPCPAIKPKLPGPAEAEFLHALERAGLDPRG